MQHTDVGDLAHEFMRACGPNRSAKTNGRCFRFGSHPDM